MTVKIDPELLPVYYHVPKSAGTYVLSWLITLCERYNTLTDDATGDTHDIRMIRRVMVELPNHGQLTCCVRFTGDFYINNQQITNHSDTKQRVSYTDLATFVQAITTGELRVFSVSVDPVVDGWNVPREAVENIKQASGRTGVLNYTVLRDPYSRARSMYCYLKSSNSSHEPTHDKYVSDNLETFLCSDELEDSWFLRNLLDIPPRDQIGPQHMNMADDRLKHWIVTDIKDVDTTIDRVFKTCYDMLRSHVPAGVFKPWRNATSNQVKTQFKDLTDDVKRSFLDRTRWDRLLWDKYCK